MNKFQVGSTNMPWNYALWLVENGRLTFNIQSELFISELSNYATLKFVNEWHGLQVCQIQQKGT